MIPRVYVDSSAYVAALVGEPQGPTVAARLAGATVVSSVLLVIETERTLMRLARERRITATALRERRDQLERELQRIELRDVDLGLCADTTWPALATPRTLDLIHLRTALWFHRRSPLAAFLTLDETQRNAAREFGLPA
ncbi:MAG: type II toxin-antitoxin system VapC family toxin [Planctomycetes bacterium]|nr:type II toxin-antitoxin system VapC family toxin [Planctomycetota bacterium]